MLLQPLDARGKVAFVGGAAVAWWWLWWSLWWWGMCLLWAIKGSHSNHENRE